MVSSPGSSASASPAVRAGQRGRATYHGRYLTAADFDARSRVLLRRSQDAVDSVTSSEIYQAGLLDAPAASLALAGQEWDIALTLREQARLRAKRAELSAAGAAPQTAAVLDRQVQAAQLADASIAGRIAALEGYAAEVREADAASTTGGRPRCWPGSTSSAWTCSPGPPLTITPSTRSRPCRGKPARSARQSANRPASRVSRHPAASLKTYR